MGLRLRLASEAGPVLLICAIGLAAAGWLLTVATGWHIFEQDPALLILVPVMLGLKGNIELTLASRLSTAWHLGQLGDRRSAVRLWIGNLALVELQSAVVGGLASLLALTAWMMTGGEVSSRSAIHLLATGVITAAIGGAVLSIVTNTIVVVSGRFGLNPDHIGGPLVAAVGDIVSLIILMLVASGFSQLSTSMLVIIIILSLAALIPLIRVAGMVPSTARARIEGWPPILTAMVMATCAGLLLERSIEIAGLLVALVPLINGLGGNTAGIHGSRLCSALHEGSDQQRGVRRTLLLLNILILIPMALVMNALGLLGDINGLHLSTGLLVIIIVQVGTSLRVGDPLARRAWSRGRDPDNDVQPYVTACADMLGILCFLIAAMWWM